MKICIACSAGGHLTEALQLLPILKKYKFFIFTYFIKGYQSDIRKYKVYYCKNPGRNFLKILKLFLLSYTILLKEKPNVIISTGAGVAIPICVLGKLFFKCKLIFIESFTRVYQPTITGKILYWFSDLFIVQWKYLLRYYGKKAIYGGFLF
jgi:UDP-N-acetylglucosamine:LPS N-acetylglucosamine transferase